ncbi:MAG: hypothetical protein ACE5EX_07550, partial [Phycisphaerae bacterium]
MGNLVDMNGDGVVDDIIGLDAKQILAQPVSAGVLSTKFGPVSAMAFDGTPRWLEVRVDGSPLSRIEMATAPATSEQVNIPPTGTPAISVDGAGNVGIGTKTPGAKLHVTGTPGADGIMFPDGKLQTTALPSPCAPEQVIKWDATTNMWICSNDIDTDTLGAIMCPLNNQIIKWNAAAGTWVCANDLDTDTDTQNTLDQAYNEGGPGAGRAITANSGAVSITVPFIGPGFGNDALTAVNNAGVGGGGAAVFQITNATNNSAALLAATNSISGQPAILGRATGNTNSAAITGQNFSAGLLAIGVEGTVVGNPMVANVGVRGSTASTGDGTTGVLGEATGTTGTIFGVQGTTPSTSDGAAGVMGEATGTTGRIFGVQGATRSAADGAAGVMGLASGATGGIFGVHGISSSTSRWTAGVKGSVGSAGMVDQNIEVATMGVHGITAFNTNKTVGVEGDATGG